MECHLDDFADGPQVSATAPLFPTTRRRLKPFETSLTPLEAPFFLPQRSTLSSTPCGWDSGSFRELNDQALGERYQGQVFRGVSCGVWKGVRAPRRGLRSLTRIGHCRGQRGLTGLRAHLIEGCSDERRFPWLRIGARGPTFLFLGCHEKDRRALASKLGSGPD